MFSSTFISPLLVTLNYQVFILKILVPLYAIFHMIKSSNMQQMFKIVKLLSQLTLV